MWSKVLAWALLLCPVTAFGPNVESTVCYDSAVAYTYTDLNSSALDFDYNYCASTIAPGVVALCINEHYASRAQEYWIEFGISFYCKPDLLDDYGTTLSNASQHIVNAPNSASEAADAPFLVPADIFANHYETEYAYADMIFLSQSYGWMIIVLGIAVMLLAGMLRLVEHSDRSGLLSSSRTSNMIRKGITTPALFNAHHARRLRVLRLEFSIPTRLETIFLCIFICLNIVLSFVSFDLFSGNYYWPKTIDQFNRYLADRTGILSIAQFPFMFAFAGRNTIFIWLTGWSFETFSVFHKWVARVSVSQAFVHTIAYTIIFYREGGLDYMVSSYKYVYLQWGASAMVAGFILVTGAIYGIRKRWYEVFLLIHIIFAIVWLVGTFYHVKLLAEPKYMPWMWVAVAFWACDRVVRIIRLLCINIHFKSTPRDLNTTITVLQDDVLKLEVPISSEWKSMPGQYVFLYFVSYKFWQSHPFTILAVTEASNTATQRTNEKSRPSIHVSEVDVTATSANTLTFVLRAHKGVTRQLLLAAKTNGGVMRTRALIEGPYGSTHRLENFDKVTLVAGGLGITACLPFLTKLSQDEPVRRQDIVLHWILRDQESISWVQKQLSQTLNLQNECKHIRIVLHITGNPKDDESKMPKSIDSILESTEVPVIKRGRPRIQELIHESVKECIDGANIAVLCCGPGGMSDECRAGVVSVLGTSRRSIRYFEESFTW